MKGSNFAHLESRAVPCTGNFSKPQIQGPQPCKPEPGRVSGSTRGPESPKRIPSIRAQMEEVEALEEERRRQKAKTLAIRSARFGRLGGTSLA